MKKFASLVLAVLMLAAMLTVFAVPASAEGTGKYIECKWNESTKSVDFIENDIPTDAIDLSSLEKGEGNEYNLDSDWYVLSEDITVNRITVNGTVNKPTNLILKDGCTLTVNGYIRLTEGYSLNIYAQRAGTGMVNVTSDQGTGIGGDVFGRVGNLTVHGGVITAIVNSGGLCAAIGCNTSGEGGNITVYDGTVTATVSNDGTFGIGGEGSTLTVYGGTVNATGREGGIKGDVTVNGGNLTASATGERDSGIYGDVTVNGGSLTVTGSSDGINGDVTVNGGSLTVTGSSDGIKGDVAVNGGSLTVTGNSRGIAYFDTLKLGDFAVIKAGDSADNSWIVQECDNQKYVQIHFHNAETCISINDTLHKCSFCGKFEEHNINNCECSCCNYHRHTWKDGKCTLCGTECKNEFHDGVYKCPDCGMQYDTSVTGSVLSEGNLTIIVGVAAFVLGLGVMFIITKKKKPALAGGTDNTDEE